MIAQKSTIVVSNYDEMVMLMFWERFEKLCKESGTSPNAVCAKIGLSTATATHWKNGSVPKGDALAKLAKYFDVSVDYLLGIEKEVEEISIARNRVRKLYKEKDIPISDIEERCNTNYTTFKVWCSGVGDYFNEKISVLADLFNVTTDYLLGRTDDINQKPGESNIKMDDFSYALYNESRELDDDDKQRLLKYARMLRNAIEERNNKSGGEQ